MTTVLKSAAYAFALYLFLMYSPTLIDFRPKTNSVQLPSFDGPLLENDILSKAEHLYEGLLHGPESIVFHNDEMYTGLEDGRIVKVKNGKIVTLAQTGRTCNLPYEEHLCGRPLGLRKGSDGLLYVVDAYYGIFTMNFTTGSLTRILSNSISVDGQTITFPDDLDIDEEGNIYFSDASSKWDLSYIYYLMLEYEGGGRLLKHNIHSGKTEVLASNLYFPNGVQLSKDKRSVLICEISNRRILRHYIAGEKTGQTEVFADNLPAEPDNIRASSRGYWVAFTSARNKTNPILMDTINAYPTVKRLWARAQHAVGALMTALAEFSTSHEIRTFAYKIKRGDIVLPLIPQHGIIIEFNERGEILRSLQSPDGVSSCFSEVREHDGYLYLGSFTNNYLGRLKL